MKSKTQKALADELAELDKNGRAELRLELKGLAGPDELTPLHARLEQAVDRFYGEFLAIAKEADAALGLDRYFQALAGVSHWFFPTSLAEDEGDEDLDELGGDYSVPAHIHIGPFLEGIRMVRQAKHTNRLQAEDRDRMARHLGEVLK